MSFIVLQLGLLTLYCAQALAVRQPHKEYAEMKIPECNDCHKSEGVAPNHVGDWLRIHRVPAGKADHNCAQCHAQDFCLDCHQGGGITADLTVENFRRDYVPKSHRSDFLALHPIKALDNPQTCYRCHDKRYCQQCHSRFPRGSLRIKSHLMLGPDRQTYRPGLNEHPTEARRNLQSCQSCHPDGDVCVQCHSSGKANPHPRNWRSIVGNIKDRTSSQVCRKCHLPGTY